MTDTTVITAPGAAFRKRSIRFIHNVTANLQGHFIFGDTLAQSARNLVRNKPNGQFIGSPALVETHAVLGAGGYLDTRIPESADLTVLVIGRAVQSVPGEKDIIFASTNNGPAVFSDGSRNSNGFSLFVEGDDATARMFAARWTGSANAPTIAVLGDNEPLVPVDQWTLLAGRCNATSADISDLTRGAAQSVTTGVFRDPNTNTIRIGNRYGVTDNGSVRVHQAMIFSGRLSDELMLIAAAQMRAIAVDAGIVV